MGIGIVVFFAVVGDEARSYIIESRLSCQTTPHQSFERGNTMSRGMLGGQG